jgi:hypothetical protein
MLATPAANMKFYGLGSSLEHLSISREMWPVSPKLFSKYLPGVKYQKITKAYEPLELLGCHNLEELFVMDARVKMNPSTVDLDTVVQCFSLRTLRLVKVDG